MLADLLPLEVTNLSAEFEVPAGWTIESAIPPDANGQYEVTEPERAVFFLGRSLTKTLSTVAGMPLEIVLSGSWPFKGPDALKPATRVMQQYLALTGFRLPRKSMIMIAPLPVAVGSIKWRAETRGSTVELLIDPNAGFQNWRGQLGVIFTHELLHLWVPNSLKFDGDYDWFFEGFTLYTALRTALELKIINFKEFLDTLARVYDSYLSYADDVSLIDASERRWTTPGSFVYDKGMLVAFLYDLLLRKESGGKTALADKYRDLFSRPVADKADGNEAIIAVLGSTPAFHDFTKSYVENSTKVELERILPAYGFSLDSTGKNSQLRVSPQLNEDQKLLLRSLGYRN
jgi:predicted metalloprotease with PDZ domain